MYKYSKSFFFFCKIYSNNLFYLQFRKIILHGNTQLNSKATVVFLANVSLSKILQECGSVQGALSSHFGHNRKQEAQD